MCGAGTIAIEADGWARRLAPGLARGKLGLERWASHGDAERRTLVLLREEARSKALAEGPPVFASDADAHTVEVARMNAADAKAKLTSDLSHADVRELAPLVPPGFVVTNPPYGERLDATEAFYGELAAGRCGCSRATRWPSSPGTPRSSWPGLKREPDRWWILFNGPIECRLQVYEIR